MKQKARPKQIKTNKELRKINGISNVEAVTAVLVTVSNGVATSLQLTRMSLAKKRLLQLKRSRPIHVMMQALATHVTGMTADVVDAVIKQTRHQKLKRLRTIKRVLRLSQKKPKSQKLLKISLAVSVNLLKSRLEFHLPGIQ